ncbi:MAG TPA: sterol desaturase family protein, partial [Steroidobacteraceae bacterium]|nr:sterol desaturase family protein [Steroidobacteraceae bacterium]
MRVLKHVVVWVGILALFAVVLVTSSNLLQHLVQTHPKAPYFLLFNLIVGIGASWSALLAAFLLELLLIGWAGSSLEALWTARTTVRLDVLAAVAMQVRDKHLDYFLTLGLLYLIGTRLPRPTTLSVAHWLPSWGLQAGCAWLLSSMVSYWIHRLQHSIPALWALHKFHHSAERLAILTTSRDTKLSLAVDSLLRVLPIAILSVPIAAKPTAASPAYALVVIYFLFTALFRFNSFVIHSNLDLGYGWVGRWLFVSPRMHRVHHSNSPTYYNRNFSFDFVMWDRLFGTYTLYEDAAQLPIGLVDNPFNTDGSLKGLLRAYFLTTYLEFWRAVRKGPTAWLPARLTVDRPSS